MPNKFPNASILTIITQVADGFENILFLYLKPIPDFYPSENIYWYEGGGQDGKSNNVWQRHSIRQRAACGKDRVMEALYEQIISTCMLKIGAQLIKFKIPAFSRVAPSSDPLKSRGEARCECLVTESNHLIPQVFFIKENLKHLEGYSIGAEEISPFIPLGIIEDGFLYRNLVMGYWGVKEIRTAYLTFKGVKEASTAGVGSKELIGFYQQDFEQGAAYTAVIKNGQQQQIGAAPIDPENGFFRISLTEATINGKIEVLKNLLEEKGIAYGLIQDYRLNIQVAEKNFTDAYGRTFLINDQAESYPLSLPSSTWQRNIYSNLQEADSKLSDSFKRILDFLGPKVVVADPYFINNIYQDNTTQAFDPTHCQTAFLNALFHSRVEKRISQIAIMGCSRVNQQLEADTAAGRSKFELMLENYEKILRSSIKMNKLESYFPAETITFRRAKEDFHNRYWFSLAEQDGVEFLEKCVIVTNSIGNINEVDFISVTETGQLRQITRKYTDIYKRSDIKLAI